MSRAEQSFSLILGKDFAGKEVELGLDRHHFLFGCNGFELLNESPRVQKAREIYPQLFNAATFPFYWGRYEPSEGKTKVETTLDAAEWCKEEGIVAKGHPLVWHTVCADWLLGYPTEVIYQKQMERIRRDVGQFRGLVDSWDVINEVVILPRFDRYDNAVSRMAKEYGAIELTLASFKLARETNPNATLLLNDFNHSPAYEALIEELLDKGCPIDAIGIQTHMHQGYRGTEYFQKLLERFSRFGLPLHFTELTLLSGDLVDPDIDDLNDAERMHWPSTEEGEARQAAELEDFYRLVYQHPSVEAIVWWDLRDGSWLNAPSGLLRRDMSPKPAFEALKRLVNQEWGFPKQKLRLDGSGVLNFRGPEGSYHLEIEGRTHKLDFRRDKADLNLQFTGAQGPRG